MNNFKHFADLVNQQISYMSDHGDLYISDADKNELWDLYLSSFPEGTNEIYKERTEHDCNCCKHFVRNIANMVAISNSEMITVWDTAEEHAKYPFNIVAGKLAERVRGSKIETVFFKQEEKYGTPVSVQLSDDMSTVTWDHFHVKLDKKHVKLDAATLQSDANSKAQVLRRSLDELSKSAVESVQELINENSIYRGAEFKSAVDEFAKLKTAYDQLNSQTSRDLFVWKHVNSFVSRFKNTVIGTLVEDISTGVDLEHAVRSYEAKVAPTDYKRPKSLITPSMIKAAMKTVDDLAIEPSLHRRHAALSDVSVNNVLYVNTKSRAKMRDTGSISDMLMGESKAKKPKTQQAMGISIQDFVDNIVPMSSEIAVEFKNSMVGNLMSVTAPKTATAPSIFKWDNNFAWSYNGNVTDSIKEKVKRAGGNVDAIMRVSLNWFNTDDLDIHVHEPNDNHIYFGNKDNKLDIDMNAGYGKVRDAVENVQWRSTPRDGIYKVRVHNFAKRESIDVGFNLQVEFDGVVYDYSYDKPATGYIDSLRIHVVNGKLDKIVKDKSILDHSSSQDAWGISTESFVPVNTVIASPNHWDDNKSGNKHWFFIVENCLNPEPVRGIYNEYLSSDLDKHRKVFEILGDKLKCDFSENQMSGFGFSSTKQESVVARVTTATSTKLYNINF